MRTAAIITREAGGYERSDDEYSSSDHSRMSEDDESEDESDSVAHEDLSDQMGTLTQKAEEHITGEGAHGQYLYPTKRRRLGKGYVAPTDRVTRRTSGGEVSGSTLM